MPVLGHIFTVCTPGKASTSRYQDNPVKENLSHPTLSPVDTAETKKLYKTFITLTVALGAKN